MFSLVLPGVSLEAYDKFLEYRFETTKVCLILTTNTRFQALTFNLP